MWYFKRVTEPADAPAWLMDNVESVWVPAPEIDLSLPRDSFLVLRGCDDIKDVLLDEKPDPEDDLTYFYARGHYKAVLRYPMLKTCDGLTMARVHDLVDTYGSVHVNYRSTLRALKLDPEVNGRSVTYGGCVLLSAPYVLRPPVSRDTGLASITANAGTYTRVNNEWKTTAAEGILKQVETVATRHKRQLGGALSIAWDSWIADLVGFNRCKSVITAVNYVSEVMATFLERRGVTFFAFSRFTTADGEEEDVYVNDPLGMDSRRGTHPRGYLRQTSQLFEMAACLCKRDLRKLLDLPEYRRSLGGAYVVLGCLTCLRQYADTVVPDADTGRDDEQAVLVLDKRLEAEVRMLAKRYPAVAKQIRDTRTEGRARVRRLLRRAKAEVDACDAVNAYASAELGKLKRGGKRKLMDPVQLGRHVATMLEKAGIQASLSQLFFDHRAGMPIDIRYGPSLSDVLDGGLDDRLTRQWLCDVDPEFEPLKRGSEHDGWDA